MPGLIEMDLRAVNYFEIGSTVSTEFLQFAVAYEAP